MLYIATRRAPAPLATTGFKDPSRQLPCTCSFPDITSRTQHASYAFKAASFRFRHLSTYTAPPDMLCCHMNSLTDKNSTYPVCRVLVDRRERPCLPQPFRTSDGSCGGKSIISWTKPSATRSSNVAGGSHTASCRRRKGGKRESEAMTAAHRLPIRLPDRPFQQSARPPQPYLCTPSPVAASLPLPKLKSYHERKPSGIRQDQVQLQAEAYSCGNAVVRAHNLSADPAGFTLADSNNPSTMTSCRAVRGY